jgi:hypothetical protein
MLHHAAGRVAVPCCSLRVGQGQSCLGDVLRRFPINLHSGADFARPKLEISAEVIQDQRVACFRCAPRYRW